jgi:hypothetical protein
VTVAANLQILLISAAVTRGISTPHIVGAVIRKATT